MSGEAEESTEAELREETEVNSEAEAEAPLRDHLVRTLKDSL